MPKSHWMWEVFRRLLLWVYFVTRRVMRLADERAGVRRFVAGTFFVRPSTAGRNQNFCPPIASSSIIPPSDATKTITPFW